MRVKNYELKDKLYLLELIEKEKTRYIITHEDYNLSYELLSLYNNDYKNFDVKGYINSLNCDNLFNYLQDINDTEEDYLIKDDINLDNLILKDSE